MLSKEDYRQRGQAVINAFNRYQAAEYNTAVSRSRTAKQWIRFTEDETANELFPNLRWLESRSAERRAEHMAFYNRIWAKTDPFWLRNQPGDLWNCSCDWEETSDDENNEGVRSSKPNKGLEGNPGETGKVFTDNCVYIQASNKDLVDRVILQMGKDAYYPKPNMNGVAVNVNPLHGIKEIAGNMDVLHTFLEQTTNIRCVELLPNITSGNEAIKPRFYPEGRTPRGKNRNADALIEFKDGAKWVADLKCMQGNGGKIIDRLKEAYEQADYSIIKINGKINIENIQKDVTSFMKQYYKFNGVMVYDREGNIIINKQRDA